MEMQRTYGSQNICCKLENLPKRISRLRGQGTANRLMWLCGESRGRSTLIQHVDFWQRGQSISMGKRSLLNKWSWNNWESILSERTLTLTSPYRQRSWIIDLNVKTKTIKLFKENIKKNFLVCTGWNFLDGTQEAITINRLKYQQIDSIKIENFCLLLRKGKGKPQMWRKYCKTYNW